MGYGWGLGGAGGKRGSRREKEAKAKDKFGKTSRAGRRDVTKAYRRPYPAPRLQLASGVSGFFLPLQGPLMREGIVTAGRTQALSHFSRNVHGGDQEDGRACLQAGVWWRAG